MIRTKLNCHICKFFRFLRRKILKFVFHSENSTIEKTVAESSTGSPAEIPVHFKYLPV